MALVTDDQGNTYDPFFGSIQNPSGKIYQVLVYDHAGNPVDVDWVATKALAEAESV